MNQGMSMQSVIAPPGLNVEVLVSVYPNKGVSAAPTMCCMIIPVGQGINVRTVTPAHPLRVVGLIVEKHRDQPIRG